MTGRGGDSARGFTIIEHPADVGVEAHGASLPEAFEQAAYGMMSLVVELEHCGAAETKTIELGPGDQEQLLVQWLSEVLYLYDAEHFLPASIAIGALGPGGLRATLSGERLEPARHTALMDVKAVTYHQVLVDADRMFVRVYLDV
jgi:SHS2 domain-containing protein